MAIIGEGSLIKKGQPVNLLADIEGKIWVKTIVKSGLDEHKKLFNVISTRLIGGMTHIHVYSENQPDTGFKQVTPDLEDVFFTHLRGTHA